MDIWPIGAKLENDMLPMSGKAWKKKMGKFSFSYMVRRTFSSESH